jgi:hypothetical protein
MSTSIHWTLPVPVSGERKARENVTVRGQRTRAYLWTYEVVPRSTTHWGRLNPHAGNRPLEYWGTVPYGQG